MGDDQRGQPEREHDVGELAAGHRIQVGRGLVEDQDRRVHREHRAGRHPASLAEAQMVRRPVGRAAHAGQGERPVDPSGQLGVPVAQVDRAEGHVVAHGGHEQLVVGVLEDDADPAPDFPQRRLADAQAVHGHRAGPRGQRAVQVQHQGRLAGPIGPEDGHPLPRGDVQVDPEQRLPAVRIGEGQLPDLQRPGRPAHPTVSAAAQTTAAAAGTDRARAQDRRGAC